AVVPAESGLLLTSCPGGAGVGAEAPEVAFGVAEVEAAGAGVVVGLVRLADDLDACRVTDALVDRVRVVGHDVHRARTRWTLRPLVGAPVTGGAEHDPATLGPDQLGVMDDVTLRDDQALLEPDDVDEEPDGGGCIGVLQRRPHGLRRRG